MSHFLLASNNDVNCIQMISMANRNWCRKGMTQVAVTCSLHKAREIASLKKIWSQVKKKWREILDHLDPQNQSKREFRYKLIDHHREHNCRVNCSPSVFPCFSLYL